MRTIELSEEEALFLADKVWFEKAYLDIDAMWGKLSPKGQEELKFLTGLYNKLLNKEKENDKIRKEESKGSKDTR